VRTKGGSDPSKIENQGGPKKTVPHTQNSERNIFFIVLQLDRQRGGRWKGANEFILLSRTKRGAKSTWQTSFAPESQKEVEKKLPTRDLGW